MKKSVLLIFMMALSLEIYGFCIKNTTPIEIYIKLGEESSTLKGFIISGSLCPFKNYMKLLVGKEMRIYSNPDSIYPIYFEPITFIPNNALDYEIIIDQGKKEVVLREELSKQEIARKKIEKNLVSRDEAEFKNYTEIEAAVKSYNTEI